MALTPFPTSSSSTPSTLPPSFLDDDLSLLPPSDVSVAIDYLIRTFPFGPPLPGFLEPRLLLVNQLYAIVHDHTAVDVELAARSRAGSIVMMRMRALGVDDFGFVRVEEYREIVESMIDGKVRRLEAMKGGEGPAEVGGVAAADTSAASASLLAPNARPIKRKRPGGEQLQREGSEKRGADGDVATAGRRSLTPAPSAPPSLISSTASSSQPRLPPLSPVTSPNRQAPLFTAAPTLPPPSLLSSSLSDKENHTVAPPPPPSAERLSDEVLLLRTVLSSLVPHHSSPSISRTHLLALLTPPIPYLTLTPDDVISTLFHHQLLLPSPDLHSTSSSSASSSFLIALPHLSRLVREVLEGREGLLRLVKGTRWKEMRKSELERRMRVKGSDRGVRWHLLEMLGGGRLLEVETTKGCMIRIPKTERRKRS